MAKLVARVGDLGALGPLLLLALCVFAYRSLLVGELRTPTGYDVESWFFTPEETSPLLALAIAGWLLWRRRSLLLALPDRRAPLLLALFLGLGAALFAWARLSEAPSLLMPSLAANLLAFASATKGRAGCRRALLPALVLLLGVPIPAPLRDELVWRLQLWSARGAAWGLQAAGQDVVLRGVQLQKGEYTFAVIEACSGLRAIETLVLVAIAVRELFAAAGWRSWLVLLLAPGLGLALNVLRAAAVVALTVGPDPETAALGQDHTPQGLAVLVAGTALLYASGRALAGAKGRQASAEPPTAPPRRISARELRAIAAWLAALAAVSLLVPPFPSAPRPPAPWLPDQRAGWVGEELLFDRVFIGPLLGGENLHRRYAREQRNGSMQVVDVLVGYEVAENPFSRFFSPKLVLPAHDWSLVENRPARIWLLGLDANLALSAREAELALAYVWRLRDGGIWWETARAALRLESGPLRREPRRAVIRLATPLAQDGPLARDRAKQTLDRFIFDFRDELAGL